MNRHELAKVQAKRKSMESGGLWNATCLWTTVQRCLDGVACEDEYQRLQQDYIRIEADAVRVVGPGKGPYTLAKTGRVMARVAECINLASDLGGNSGRNCSCGRPLAKRRRLCDQCKRLKHRENMRDVMRKK